ncbi:MAG: hypothetical protein AB1656_07070, partial [Candidatus Omnitrophota bacterium]
SIIKSAKWKNLLPCKKESFANGSAIKIVNRIETQAAYEGGKGKVVSALDLSLRLVGKDQRPLGIRVKAFFNNATIKIH